MKGLQQQCRPLDGGLRCTDLLPGAGFVHIQQREWKEAEDTFKELRSEPSLKNDPYAMMAQGIIPLVSLKADSKKASPLPPSCPTTASWPWR